MSKTNPALTVLGEELASQYAGLTDDALVCEVEEVTDRVSPSDKFRVPSEKQLGTFHNSTTSRVIQHEKPWHRYCLHLMARARMTVKEVAETLQVSADQVGRLVRQPWFQEQYNALVSARADSLYDQLIEGEDVNSLLTLVELRDNPNVKSATRAMCATDILDRLKGKSVQRTLSISSTIKQTSDIDEMKAEQAAIDRQLESMLGASQKRPNVSGVVR